MTEFEEQLRKAEQGGIIAQHDLGVSYRSGNGTEKDLGKAKYWLEKVASIDVNSERAKEHFSNTHGRLPSYSAIAQAQAKLANIYIDENNTKAAIYWWKRLADIDKNYNTAMQRRCTKSIKRIFLLIHRFTAYIFISYYKRNLRLFYFSKFLYYTFG